MSHQITVMGIGKRTDRCRWSPQEKERLAELIQQYCSRKVAQIMHRSLNAVLSMAKRIRVSTRARDGWFTKQEVCEILGQDSRWVQRRFDSGALRASYHHGHRPYRVGRAAWHIQENDLREFIRQYPEELSGSNVDFIMIVDILAGVANKHSQ